MQVSIRREVLLIRDKWVIYQRIIEYENRIKVYVGHAPCFKDGIGATFDDKNGCFYCIRCKLKMSSEESIFFNDLLNFMRLSLDESQASVT